MSLVLLLSAAALAANEREVDFTAADEVVLKRAESTVPFGTSLDRIADDWSIDVTLRLVTEVRLGAALTGRSRLTWDDVGFHHALKDVATEGWVTIAASFAVDVAISEGGTPLTSATLASVPAEVRVAATIPRTLDADEAELVLQGTGPTTAEAPWASEDASVSWAQVIDPGLGVGEASGTLRGDDVVVEQGGAPLADPFWQVDPTDTVDVALGWTAAGVVDAVWSWTNPPLYGVMSVLGLRNVTVIVPMQDRQTVDEVGLAGELDAAVTIAHPVPRLGLPNRPIDLGRTGVDVPRLTTVEIPALGTEPVHVELWVEGSGVTAMVDTFDVSPITPSRLDLVLRPLAEGPIDAVLHVVSDDPWTPTLDLPLQGEGVSGTTDEGCACTTGAGTSAVAPLGVALLALLRRRRR